MSLDEGAHRLLDPRWQWISASIRALFDEMEPGQRITGLVLGVQDREGVIMHYTAIPGDPPVRRHIITKAAHKRAAQFADEAIDVTMNDPI